MAALANSPTKKSANDALSLQRDALALELEALRRQARTDFRAFVTAMTPPDYDIGQHHQILYDHLFHFARKEIELLIIEMPPGHGKSEGVSRNLPAFLLGSNPDNRIIACSHTSDLAEDMCLDVQGIMARPEYDAIFPDVLKTDTRTRRRTDVFNIPRHRGYYRAAGIGTGISGRRFDFGLIDDPVKDRITANSPTLREQAWRWYSAVFRTRQAKGAKICVCGTRWHSDDLIGRIKDKHPKAVILTMPALATAELHQRDKRQFGEALWPWFKSKEWLENEQDIEPLDFAALYQQQPMAEGAIEWGADLFPPSIWFDDWPKDLLQLTVSLDPSKGKDAKTGDYSAFVLLGTDKAGNVWIEADLKRRNSTVIVEDGLELIHRFEKETGSRIAGFVCEANTFQYLFVGHFRKRQQELGRPPLPLYEVEHKIPKQVRIRRLTPYLTKSKLRFRNTRGTRLLVQQMREFPVGQFDDGPDSLAMNIRHAEDLWFGKAR